MFLKRNITTIFIMLGFNCNLNCKYCLQYPMVEHQIQTEINPDIYDFIFQIANESAPNNINIRFFGGEPLLYFNQIKEIYKHLKDCSNLTFSIISNGKALNDDIIKFFNDNNFIVSISYDGYHSIDTRGYDIVKEKKEYLLKIKNLHILSVLSAYSYPLELFKSWSELDEEYFKIYNHHLECVLENILDTGLTDKSLINIDYNRLYSEIEYLINIFLQNKGNNNKNELSYYEYIYIDYLVSIINNYYCNSDGKYNNYYSSCSNGFNILNLDLQGNLYHCHNNSEIAGTIYSNYFTYLNNILKKEYIIAEYRKKCEQCLAVAFCCGGCKMISEKEREESFCILKKVILVPVINALEKFGRTKDE